MKKITSLLFASALLLAACNNKSKDNNAANKETATNTGSNTSNETTMPGNDMAKMMEEMKKLPALSTDQLKAMLPETLMDMKRSSFSANSGMGYGIADARYKTDDDSKQLHVTIYDCVGTAGVAWYSMMYWGMNIDQEDDNGYKKTTTFNGSKAIESFEKGQNQYGLMFPASNRLLVNVEGENTGLDAVKQAASSLNLKVN